MLMFGIAREDEGGTLRSHEDEIGQAVVVEVVRQNAVGSRPRGRRILVFRKASAVLISRVTRQSDLP